MERKIGFNEWNTNRLKEGKKTSTIRHTKKGKEGDTFKVDNKTYVLDFIVELPMWFICRWLFRTEGCYSSTGFMLMWKKIEKYKPDDMMWYHHFSEVK